MSCVHGSGILLKSRGMVVGGGSRQVHLHVRMHVCVCVCVCVCARARSLACVCVCVTWCLHLQVRISSSFRSWPGVCPKTLSPMVSPGATSTSGSPLPCSPYSASSASDSSRSSERAVAQGLLSMPCLQLAWSRACTLNHCYRGLSAFPGGDGGAG